MLYDGGAVAERVRFNSWREREEVALKRSTHSVLETLRLTAHKTSFGVWLCECFVRACACLGSVSVCLCLCSVERNVTCESRESTSIGKKKLPLYPACSKGATEVSRSAAPTAQTRDPSTRRHVSAWADINTRSRLVGHLPTACGLHCPFDAAVVTKSRPSLRL